MKKFMKAIAFVTVMCLAFSTVAFATGANDDNHDKIIDVTVTNAGNDQVALVIVEEGADLSNPLYVNQTGAVGGTATFEAVLTNVDVEAVDVYVGYATYAEAGNTAPLKVDTVELVKPITEVTIANVSTKIVEGGEAEGLKALEQTGAGVAIIFDIVAPENVSATKMIWAIRYIGADAKEHVKYSQIFNVSGYGIGTVLTEGVELGLAFLNGSEVNEIKPVDITAVDVIFSFSDGEEVLTNEADAAKKGNKAN
ncbi:MAG: hypothetical protein E7406_00115 [Ruminococcaceae bacterium]|nr:hypothetical protein [Oscillospiraceae bacterium]